MGKNGDGVVPLMGTTDDDGAVERIGLGPSIRANGDG